MKNINGPVWAIIATGLLIVIVVFNFYSAKTGTEITNNTKAANSTTGAIFLFNKEAKTLYGINLQTGVVSATWDLEYVPRKIVPTPGGVSVFIIYENVPIIDVYSAETFEFQRRTVVDYPGISDLTFSQNGHTVWLTIKDDTAAHDRPIFVEYQHRLLELTNPKVVVDLPISNANDNISTQQIFEEIHGAAVSIVKRDGSFACF